MKHSVPTSTKTWQIQGLDTSLGTKPKLSNQFTYYSLKTLLNTVLPSINWKTKKSPRFTTYKKNTPRQDSVDNNGLFKHTPNLIKSITWRESTVSGIESIVFNKKRPIALRKKLNIGSVTNKASNTKPSPSFSSVNNSIKTVNANNTHMTLQSLKHLGNMLQVSCYKKTIIIDDEGNNNLNIDRNRMMTIQRKKTFEEHNCIKESIGDKTPSSSLSKSNGNRNDDRNANTKATERFCEYKHIFDILNKNIIQMKEIIKENDIVYCKSNDNNNNNANDGISINKISTCTNNLNSITINNDNEGKYSFLSSYDTDFLKLFLLDSQGPDTGTQNSKANENENENCNSSDLILSTDNMTQWNTVMNIECEISDEKNEENCQLKHIPHLSPHFILSAKME